MGLHTDIRLVLFVCSHAIVSSAVGPEYYVGITSFVDKTQLEPGCSVLLHNKVGCWGMVQAGIAEATQQAAAAPHSA